MNQATKLKSRGSGARKTLIAKLWETGEMGWRKRW